MNLEIKIAGTKKELNEAFKLRYTVFGKELNYVDKTKFTEGVEKDNFDELPITTNFVAQKDNETVGTVRLIANSDLEYNIEHFVNIDNLKKDKNINLAEASRFCVKKNERLNDNISLGLCKIVYNYAFSQDITDIIILSNSTKSKEGNTIEYFENIGFYQFSDEIYYEKFNEYAIPLRLNLKKVSRLFMYFLKKRSTFIEKPYDILNLNLVCDG